MIEVKQVKTKRWRFSRIVHNFLLYDESYRKIRKRHRYQGNACFICGHKFEDGEIMGLAIGEGNVNRVVCNSHDNESAPTPGE